MAKEKIVYWTQDREDKIIQTFKDQKEKYNKEVLATAKIQSLSGMNAYVFEEVLKEMEVLGKIKLVESKGTKKYWRLS